MTDPEHECITFQVHGVPVPQGSARAFVVKGRAIITSANRSLSVWRRLVADTAQRYAPGEVWRGPVRLTLRFYVDRPKSEPTHAGRGKDRHPIKTWPDRRPDLDKLVRAAMDSLTGVIFRDDSQVIDLRATKEWGAPGVLVLVTRGTGLDPPSKR
ncbi:MAG: RusA family crossover junction endodeoxyribonuclease [Thermoplasmata archaeon]